MTESAYEITKGALDEAQRVALTRTLDGIAAEARAIRSAKPDTRGHYGVHAVRHANPAGFRNPRMPRS
ncbi:MAG TPA: acyl-CoA carboxylase subunit epsilon [Candidatus Corynebacterium gallistercoris]|uniref:Acyl-CoA carboxylase subunit epsilon n=1 Tax=Candidatus Corynebacterium gallistercoris TaxID=2838530 RepID=A0A9D1RYJ9_9CORY|nr:acyl-CoA carboxylase subunit epsilon [Candidatus Corynebacterium gallistercoris]